MKKFLLTALSCLFATTTLMAASPLKADPSAAPIQRPDRTQKAPAKADAQSIDFTWCQGAEAGLGIGKECYMCATMQIPASIAKEYSGAHISEISMAIGSNSYTDATVFVTKSLDSAPIYQQNVTLPGKNLYTWVPVTLTTPVDVPAEGCYIGYTIKVGAKDYPMFLDGVPNNNPASGVLGFGSSADYTKMTFENTYSSFGAVSIVATLEGTLPQILCMPMSVSTPPYVSNSKPFVAQVLLGNFGTADISSVKISTDWNGTPGEARTLDFSADPLKSGTMGIINIDGLTRSEKGQCNIKFAIAAVNGQQIETPRSLAATSYVLSTTKPLMMVVEEATSNGCGWCPIGIMGIEAMKKNHPDDFIAIAAHCTGQGNDPMIIAEYNKLPSFTGGNLPGCVANRVADLVYQNYPQASYLEDCYQQNFNSAARGGVGMVDIDLVDAKYTTVEKSSVKIKTSAKFGTDFYNSADNIRMMYVVVENKVGPYKQTNYCSGQSEYGEWGKYANPQEWLFDDVARYSSGINGIAGSLPATIKEGEAYEYEIELPLMDLKNYFNDTFNVNPDNMEIIALVYNVGTSSSQRMILNAVRFTPDMIKEDTEHHYQQIIWDQKFESTYNPGQTVELTARSTRDLPITYTVTDGADVATVEGNKLTFNGIGTVTVEASQAGDANTMAAVPVSVTLTCKKTQEISWAQDLSGIEPNVGVTLEATATSGLPVSFKINPYSRFATIKNGVLTFKQAATIKVMASQGGNAEYMAAESVTREITCEDSGIEAISMDETSGALYFDLSGVRIANPETNTLYIEVRGTKARKVVIK